MESSPQQHWHHLPAAEVAALLESDPGRGLETNEAEQRLARFGPNRLTQKKGRGPLLRLLLQFHQPLIYILLVSSAITAALPATRMGRAREPARMSGQRSTPRRRLPTMRMGCAPPDMSGTPAVP